MTEETEILNDLVSRAARGDHAAQDELFRRVSPLLVKAVRARRRVLYPNAAEKHEVDDLTQALAIRLLQSLPRHTFQGRRAFTAWIYRLANCELIDQLRHDRAQRRRGEDTDLDGKPLAQTARSMESLLDQEQRTLVLNTALRELPDHHATAVWLHGLGHSHEEVGEVLGVTPEAARKLVARARAKLVRATGEQPA